jgi:hypothetical protein
MATLDSLAVGTMRREQLKIAITAELDRIGAAIGTRVTALVGYTFFKDARLDIDYARRRVGFATGTDSVRPPEDSGAVFLPFRLAAPRKPLAIVAVDVNSRGPFAFAIDTGASTTVVSTALADSLDLVTRTIPPLTGGGGTIDAAAAQLTSVRLGTLDLADLDVVVSDFLAMLSQVAGTPLDGVLGHNVLKQFRVGIDYPRLELSLARIG